jgi:hypothetical protein
MPEMPDGSFEIDDEFVKQFIEPVGFRREEAAIRYPKLFPRATPEPQIVDYSKWMPTVRLEDDETLETMPLERLIYEAVGTATTCWSDLSHAGVFESESCASISQRLTELMRLRGAS